MEPDISICMGGADVTTGESCDEHAIDIDVWNGDEASDTVKERTESGLPRIPKVPATLRNSQDIRLPQWIQPSVFSIGPYYYKHKNFRIAQKLKSLLAEKFIKESNQERDDLYHKIKTETPQLKKCYDNLEISKYTDNQLATMFLLDGCFLLHFINCSREEDGFSNFDFTNHEIAYIKQDLFLLENQLPYKVLKLLLEEAKNSKPMEDMIEDFVTSNIPMPRGIVGILKIDVPCHLLHFLQGAFLGRLETMTPRRETTQTELMRERKSFRKGQERPIWHSCKNVQQLVAAGIRFKPSRTNRLTDISFTSYFGITGCLMLPPVTMNTSTFIIFLNLIAFESCNGTNQLGVISYLCFLDSLIDHWDDVKELQAARVLHNFVGDQKEVAQFFNHVCGKLVTNPSTYKEVQQRIQVHLERYYSSKVRMWLSQCRYTYFSSPWSIIALTGAILGLFLTAIQAYTSLFFRSTN